MTEAHPEGGSGVITPLEIFNFAQELFNRYIFINENTYNCNYAESNKVCVL